MISQMEGARDRATRDALLVAYRDAIERESALIKGARSAGQVREMAEVDDLARLARGPGNREPLRALVTRIAARERGEAEAVATEMHQLRERTIILAVTLSAGAALLSLAGGWALLAANRTLERDVAARTGELAEANARLVEIDRSRRLFFAKTGHELRTPITALRGEAEVALGDPAPTIATLTEAITHIGVQAGLLGRRVEDLLTLARADEGKIALQRAPIDLSAVVMEAIDQAAPHARSNAVALAVDSEGARIPLLGDAKWLVQALVAILDNGIKFAPANSTLRLAVAHAAGDASIAISDTGPGVLPVELPRVFDAYYQTAEGVSRGGSGLGLALARWVVDQHGGSIVARNDDPGCTILLHLPVAA
ncbi:sensor histidine kinase [Sphingomonas immobilis]|uniref:histidine kinase n=1 Tax=Sphingomonas immobilis TaxID=3063997 RepID=A0ABT9A3C0_9SPHN|nr:ATP-binding protein [Sphingomonas sp. CA1-15]MDO7843917.1 ATP-binding protein [Sphingomonas sp. CA1-15]